ncbi:hypothetical protein Aph01nite_54550 [Acrocarpospora phusangensis]|uniref:Secreted protein n=1 Tax=Acrocarpospora phusangensis TaxID=1070424 RepID=A0A919QIU4_9ACTN|nr:hypothetical protein [Acrocarpospora phusangensis]GIH27145.1 hypothetical protein Aph01nite_54550 [Acrocarpospora phusangensis]
MGTRKWVAAASATTMLTAALVAGTASSAQAVPTNCSTQLNTQQRWATSFCSGGTGEHRIRVLQRHFLPEVGLIPIEGPWVSVGSVSYATISPHTTINVWVETRG